MYNFHPSLDKSNEVRNPTAYLPGVFLNGSHAGGAGHARDTQETLLKVSVLPLKGFILLPRAGDAAVVG